MTSLKRKASIELTRNSIVVVEPVATPNNMIQLTGAIARAWSWCKNWCASLMGLSTYSTMSYTSTDVIAETHIQSSESRQDGTTSVKRQRTRPKTSRSRSAIDPSRRTQYGVLDYTGCITERDFERRAQKFWAPPELSLKKSSKHKPPPSPEPSVIDEDEPNDQSLHQFRRGSDPCLSPRTPDSMSSPRRSQEPYEETMTAFLKASKTKARSKGPESNYTKGMSLEERMNLLLVVEDKDVEVGSQLHISRYVSEKRERLAKEKKEREKEEAVRAQEAAERERAAAAAREKEEAARIAKELRLHRRFPTKPLVQSLPQIWEEKVRQAEKANHQQVITTSIAGIELHLKDFQTVLRHGAWLNDEIVNSYLEWIVDAANKAATADSKARGEKIGTVPKFIAHNSYFYSNLETKGPNSTERLMKKKKAPGKSLMDVDSVIVPICKGNHWTVGVVRPITKTIEYFDSFGSGSERFVGHMRKWLQFQLGSSYIEEEWEAPHTPCAPQSNGYDCGVFVCTNSLCIALGLDTLCYSERDLTQQRRNIAAVLLNRGFTGDFVWGKEL